MLSFLLLSLAGGLSWEQTHTQDHRTGSTLEVILIVNTQTVLISTNEGPALTSFPFPPLHHHIRSHICSFGTDAAAALSGFPSFNQVYTSHTAHHIYRNVCNVACIEIRVLSTHSSKFYISDG